MNIPVWKLVLFVAVMVGVMWLLIPSPREQGVLLEASGEKQQALVKMEKAYRQDPRDVRVALSLARLKLWQGDVATAEAIIRKALPEKRETEKFKGLLRELLAETNRPTAALAELEARYEKTRDRSLEQPLLDHYLFAKDLEKALGMVQAQRKRGPKNKDLALMELRLLARMGKRKEALQSARAYLNLAPGDSFALSLLIRHAKLDGAVDQELKLWERLALHHGEDAQVQLNYAQRLFELGQKDKALARFEHLAARAGDLPAWVLMELAGLYEGQDSTRALAYLEQYLAQKPEDPFAYMALAELYLKTRQPGKAREVTDRFLARLSSWPYNKETHSWAAAKWVERGQFQKAQKLLRRLLADHPEELSLMLAYLDALEADHQYQMGRVVIDRYLKTHPHHLELTLRKAYFLHKLKAYAKRDAVLASLEHLEGLGPEQQLRLAELWLATRTYPKAQSLLLDLLSRQPQHDPARGLLAQVYVETERYRDALSMLDKAKTETWYMRQTRGEASGALGYPRKTVSTFRALHEEHPERHPIFFSKRYQEERFLPQVHVFGELYKGPLGERVLKWEEQWQHHWSQTARLEQFFQHYNMDKPGRGGLLGVEEDFGQVGFTLWYRLADHLEAGGGVTAFESRDDDIVAPHLKLRYQKGKTLVETGVEGNKLWLDPLEAVRLGGRYDGIYAQGETEVWEDLTLSADFKRRKFDINRLTNPFTLRNEFGTQTQFGLGASYQLLSQDPLRVPQLSVFYRFHQSRYSKPFSAYTLLVPLLKKEQRQTVGFFHGHDWSSSLNTQTALSWGWDNIRGTEGLGLYHRINWYPWETVKVFGAYELSSESATTEGGESHRFTFGLSVYF